MPVESVAPVNFIVFRQQLKLDAPRRRLILLQPPQGLPQLLVDHLQMLAVLAVFPPQPGALQGVRDGVLQHRHVLDRLGDVVPGAELERLNGVAHAAQTGHHQDRQLRVVAGHGGQHMQAVHARQTQIAQHQIGSLATDEVDAGLAVERLENLEAAVLQKGGQHFEDQLLVVDHQDARGFFGHGRTSSRGAASVLTAAASGAMSSRGLR